MQIKRQTSKHEYRLVLTCTLSTAIVSTGHRQCCFVSGSDGDENQETVRRWSVGVDHPRRRALILRAVRQGIPSSSDYLLTYVSSDDGTVTSCWNSNVVIQITLILFDHKLSQMLVVFSNYFTFGLRDSGSDETQVYKLWVASVYLGQNSSERNVFGSGFFVRHKTCH